MSGEVLHRTFAARLDCHYLLRAPAVPDSRAILVVTLHGFGSNPATMLRLTERMFDGNAVIAAPEGPNQFFLGDRTNVGYGWITNSHPAESIRLHHDMVTHVLSEAGRQFDIPPERRLLAGFSQAVALNYRFAATCSDAIRGVIGICGGLPGDWESGSYRQVKAAILHIARMDDEFYPPATTQQYAGRLRQRAADVEFHLIEGGHSMPSSGKEIVPPWAGRVLNLQRP